MADKRKSYPSDVNDDEWAFCVQHLTLMTEKAPQRDYPLRELFHGLRWLASAGSPWRTIAHDLRPGAAVYQQIQRWISAGSCDSLIHDLRSILRLLQDRNPVQGAVYMDRRTLQ